MHSMTTKDERFYDKFDGAKNSHPEVKSVSQSQPFELKKELEHEEEEKCHESY